MGYAIRQDVFDKTFLDKKKTFHHKTNELYNLFPYNTKDQSDKIISDFDGILGAFLQDIYSEQAPNEISRDAIIEEICKGVSFENNPVNKYKFVSILKELYFKDEHNLKCTCLNTYKYIGCAKNVNKISEYIVGAICDKESIIKKLSEHSGANTNVLDKLVESHLPKLSPKKPGKSYLQLFPQIKEMFTNDLIFLIGNSNTEFPDLIQLISYYYFFYTSQVILRLNDFCQSNEEIKPVFFCMNWEKTSQSRKCYLQGWHHMENMLNTMFAHAVLLEILNQTGNEKKYSYKDIFNEYNASSNEEKNEIFSCIENINQNYREKYAPEDGFLYGEVNYTQGNLESLLHSFFDDIALQFQKSTRARANEAYQKSFFLFCKNNFLQNRKRNGLMLVLNEEQLVLFTKIIIGNEQKMRLNELFKEFSRRGIGMDRQTQECVVEFYEKLNLIEKKSDSGDAQYVKGIL